MLKFFFVCLYVPAFAFSLHFNLKSNESALRERNSTVRQVLYNVVRSKAHV